MRPETLSVLLARARARLQQARIETAALDARLLLQHAAGIDHGALIADPDLVAGEACVQALEGFVARRLSREPVSRILGTREFHGRPFAIGPATLDPRPDTETVIDAALTLLNGRARFLDLGTGSGAIAVTLLAERPLALGTATDVSPQALACAAANAGRHGVAGRLELALANWFEDLRDSYDLIVSNPPYISSGDIATLAPEVRDYDPVLALDGGPDGLTAYRCIAAGAPAFLAPGGSVLVEIGAGQEAPVAALFAAAGLAGRGSWRDLGGRVRCLAFAAARGNAAK